MPNGIGGAPGPGWLGHFLTGTLGALTVVFGTEAWKEMRGELKDGLKKILNVDRQLYTVTLMALEQLAPNLAATLKRRRSGAEAKPFAENRQVRLITKLLQAYKDDDPEVWEKRVVAMAWLALQDDTDFEGTLNGIENDNAKQAARAVHEGWQLIEPKLQQAAEQVATRLTGTRDFDEAKTKIRQERERIRADANKRGWRGWLSL